MTLRAVKSGKRLRHVDVESLSLKTEAAALSQTVSDLPRGRSLARRPLNTPPPLLLSHAEKKAGFCPTAYIACNVQRTIQVAELQKNK